MAASSNSRLSQRPPWLWPAKATDLGTSTEIRGSRPRHTGGVCNEIRERQHTAGTGVYRGTDTVFGQGSPPPKSHEMPLENERRTVETRVEILTREPRAKEGGWMRLWNERLGEYGIGQGSPAVPGLKITQCDEVTIDRRHMKS